MISRLQTERQERRDAHRELRHLIEQEHAYVGSVRAFWRDLDDGEYDAGPAAGQLVSEAASAAETAVWKLRQALKVMR